MIPTRPIPPTFEVIKTPYHMNLRHILRLFLTLQLMLTVFLAFAQTNVRAWYAQGQVWVIWQAKLPLPETYAIYKSTTAFSNVSQATPIGRPFAYEYLPGTFIEQTLNKQFAYTIPKPDGGTYTLAPGEGLFVETATNSGSAYYAVVEWGKTAVNAGVNLTTAAVKYTYDPVKEPVTCHLQLANTLNGGYPAKWYALWMLGKQDHSAGRPDFPVMANVYKNGMPAMFILSEALNMDTSGGKLVPATHWLHGGGGLAIHHTADKTGQFNIAPRLGISVSHTDDFTRVIVNEGDTVMTSGRTSWFGWAKSYNPFDPIADAKPGDTLINYTQRRILWVNNWIQRNYRVDPSRIALQGYSMGSGGVSALGKAFPELFSTVSAFNNGYRRVNEATITQIHGTVEENLPTNLRYPNGQAVRINEVLDLPTSFSSARDLPIFRTWAGKNDINDRMHWGPDLLAQYRKADSLGYGTQISWDERPHTYDELNYHWIQGLGASNQTAMDNLATQELFSTKQSYPAFFNHRLDPNNNDPGTGKLGINNGDGDNWGTWGGFHRWDLNGVQDQAGMWSAIVWLESKASFTNDNCPINSLIADLALRRLQKFSPRPGSEVNWQVRDLATNAILQSGKVTVRPDGLVVLPKIVVYKENQRKVRIVVTDPLVTTKQASEELKFKLQIEPNPSYGAATLTLTSPKPAEATVRAIAASGQGTAFKTSLSAGKNRVPLTAFDGLPAGFYAIEVVVEGQRNVGKWLKW